MHKPLVILISSDLPQMGKDTCAEFIVNSLKTYSDTKTLICRFADELKNYVHAKYEVNTDLLAIDPMYKENIRHYYIEEGDGARLYDAFVWCKKMAEAYIKPFFQTVKEHEVPIIIIPDSRYLNEIDFFREKKLCGFDAYVWTIHVLTNKSIMIDRFGCAKFDKLASTLMSRSQRELNLSFGTEFNSVLPNNRSKDEFRQRVHLETEIIVKNYIDHLTTK